MRLVPKTPLSLTFAIVTAVGIAVGAGSAALFAGDDDEPAGGADAAKVAQEALDKAVLRGKEIWTDKGITKAAKSCTSCHDDPNKPDRQIKNRTFSYPGYSKRRKAIVTLQQKLQDMIANNAKGTALDDKGTDIAALEAYVLSLKK